MIDAASVPAVTPDELLSRFATQSGQFREANKTVKQELFLPHPRPECSVMRHRDARDEEIWQIGCDVAGSFAPPRTLSFFSWA
jgi:hypothetical protein